jgi:hypothetical protein
MSNALFMHSHLIVSKHDTVFDGAPRIPLKLCQHHLCEFVSAKLAIASQEPPLVSQNFKVIVCQVDPIDLRTSCLVF